MEETLVKTVELENGLTLEIFDASIKIAADRYKVVLIARMDIDVNNTLKLGGFPENIDVEDIKNRLPETILFERKNERFFVEEKEKDAVFGAILDACLDQAHRYFSRKDFPVKFILKTCREANPT